MEGLISMGPNLSSFLYYTVLLHLQTIADTFVLVYSV